MKKYLILIMLLLGICSVNAQNKNDGSYDYYMDVYLDWGGKNHTVMVFLENNEGEYIYGSDGEKLKFKSRSAVINYFVKLGWTYVEDMLTRVGSEMLLFKKQINSVQDAKEGLILKEGLKK
jgi:hypothetical protein